MARQDEKGQWHPTEDDEWKVDVQIHMIYCPECSQLALAPVQEVVEAAKALFEFDFDGTPALWEYMSEATKQTYLDRAKAALDAVTPRRA